MMEFSVIVAVAAPRIECRSRFLNQIIEYELLNGNLRNSLIFLHFLRTSNKLIN